MRNGYPAHRDIRWTEGGQCFQKHCNSGLTGVEDDWSRDTSLGCSPASQCSRSPGICRSSRGVRGHCWPRGMPRGLGSVSVCDTKNRDEVVHPPPASVAGPLRREAAQVPHAHLSRDKGVEGSFTSAGTFRGNAEEDLACVYYVCAVRRLLHFAC